MMGIAFIIALAGLSLVAQSVGAADTTTVKMRVAGAQIAVTTDVAANRDALLRSIAAAKALGAQYMVTPEGALSGYVPDVNMTAVNEALPIVLAAAKDAGVGLFLGTIFVEADGHKYDQQRVYDVDGSYLGFNAKQLLTTDPHFPGTGEVSQYVAGKPTVFALRDAPGVAAGALICNDMWADPSCSTHDPMLSHKLARDFGARVIFHSVNGGPGNLGVALPFHHSNLQYRAQADKLFIVVAQAVYAEGQNQASGVVAPDGTWVVQSPLGVEHVYAAEIEVAV